MQKFSGRLYRCLPGLRAQRLIRDDRGVTAVEYGLIVFIIVPVIMGAVALLGTRIGTLFSSFVTSFLGFL